MRLALLLLFTLETTKAANNTALFPVGPTVKKQVRFWKKIFRNYPSTMIVIHDTKTPEHIIDIIDFKLWAEHNNLKKVPKKKKQEQIITSYLKRYRLAIDRFHKQGLNARKISPMEQRIYEIYSRQNKTLAKLLRAQVKIRSQRGLADEFLRASQRARPYIYYMEKVFKKAGLPTELTRLPFVESMFNLKAHSRVGASGIWQFMPNTAKNYLRINKLVDERHSPYKATKAAAKLLRHNYKKLKSWPLAITAYNTGLGSMLRAKKRLGPSLDRLIHHYRGRSFHFASKNFYAEFLAAKETYDWLLQRRRVPKPMPDRIRSLKLPKNWSLQALLKHTPLTKRLLRSYNPCIRDKSYGPYRWNKLGKYYELYLPTKVSYQIEAALGKKI